VNKNLLDFFLIPYLLFIINSPYLNITKATISFLVEEELKGFKDEKQFLFKG